MSVVNVSIESQIGTITINDPQTKNALSLEIREEMTRVLHEMEMDPEVRCVVLKGAGDSFISGGDVKNFASIINSQNGPQRRNEFMGRVQRLNRLIMAMHRMPKPIIAAVQGPAAGAGVSLAIACDMVIASDNSFFIMAYPHIGLCPDGGATYQLPRAIGIKKAMEMALLGDRISAEKACELGLINKVVPRSDLDTETLKLATRLAKGPTRALGYTKQLLYRSMENSFETQLQMEAEMFGHASSEDDFAEGAQAFTEKRKPNFKGK